MMKLVEKGRPIAEGKGWFHCEMIKLFLKEKKNHFFAYDFSKNK